MSTLYWIDLLSNIITAVIATALTLMALGLGPKQTLNRFFALFTLTEAVWRIAAIPLRLFLGFPMGDPTFWLELSGFGFGLMGPCLLLFSIRYVGYRKVWLNAIAALGVIGIGLLGIPIFRHQVLFNPHLDKAGLLTYEFSGFGYAATLVPLVYIVWSAAIFWRERRRTGELYLALSAFLLVAGSIVGTLLRPFLPFPALSSAAAFSIVILAWGVISRQLFNPLRERTAELEREIAGRKQVEEELERHRDHLEELVEERTRELKETQAELLRKERLSALGQLTATVAHEIRNPLGTVRTAVFAIGDAIERGELYRVDRARQLVERNIIRCDRIISDLLDYTRERALNLEPVYVDVWLDALLDEQDIPESIVCVRNLDAGAQVPIDREHLRRAVINVVENAIHALQEDAALLTAADNRLTVSTHAVAGRLEIKVGDTGPGIPAEVMDRIFEPLFSTKTYGVGLGMSIVKNIMQQHSGGIEIQGEVGEGTTVTLWLPTQQRIEK